MIATRKLAGKKCFCATCGLYFKSDAGFDKHRTGSFEKGTRRCRTTEEMLKVKMIEKDGWWSTGAMPTRLYD